VAPVVRVPARCYGGQSRGCIWTLRHRHLIQPYLAYYDRLESHYGVLGVPLYLGGAIRRIYRYLSRLSIQKCKVYWFLVCSLWGVPIHSRPHTIFKFVWGLPAGTEDPKNEVVDNLPRYAG
jgi:hypothetical protein